MSINATATSGQTGQLSDEQIIAQLPPEMQEQYKQWKRTQAETPQSPDTEAAEEKAERKKGNPFPIHALPPAMRDLAIQVAKNAKSEDKIGVVALPMIGCLSSALGQGIAVQGREYVSYPNVYVYCSLASGVFKSVALVMLRILSRCFKLDLSRSLPSKKNRTYWQKETNRK
jgi:hypothetical protein